MPNIGLALGGLAEGYQQQQERQQRQLYQQFLMQQAQQQAAQQAQALTQQQQALGAAWGAAGQLGGGGMGGPPPPQQQPQPGGGLAPGIQRGPGGMLTQNGRPPDTMLPGGQPGWLSQIKQAESGGNYNVGYGGVDLSNAPKDATGFPQWQGGTGPTGQPTHAAGAYQFQPDTWKKYAGGLGVTDFSPQSQDKVAQAAYQDQGMKPWASNPKLAPLVSEAKQTSQQVTQAVPQQQWGRSSVSDLARAVEQANPDATPQVKMLALMQLQKLMAPTEKAELQTMLQQNRGLIQEEIAKMRSDTQLAVGEMRGRSAADAEAGRNERFDKGEAGRNARAQARNDIQTIKAQRQAAGTNPATRRLALQNLLTDIDAKIRATDDDAAKAEYQTEREDIVKEMQGLAGVPKRNPTPRKDVDQGGAAAALPPQ